MQAGAQGSVANLMRPVSFSVFTSKVRISLTPPTSSVTTMRSAATAVAITRAPLGSAMVASAGTPGAGSPGMENPVADDGDHRDDCDHRREAGYDQEPARPRHHAGRLAGYGRTLRRGLTVVLVFVASRFTGG